MILLDGIFCGQRGTAQQYHKHNEAVKKRFRNEPMNANSHPMNVEKISLRKSERVKSIRLPTNILTEINNSAVLTADTAELNTVELYRAGREGLSSPITS